MNETTSSQSSHLIIGCGYVGRRVAMRWIEQGRHVAALTRNRAGELRELGIEPILGDVLGAPPSWPSAKTVLYAVGMDRTSGKSFREVYVDGLRNVLGSLPPFERFIYISSTSVYGQTEGEIVDEGSTTQPIEENGQIVLEAEHLLRAKIPSAIILRFAGIYGPGRVIRRSAIEKGEPLSSDPEKWLNLIHVEDGVSAVLAAESRGQAGETYLIADDLPVRRRDFYTIMAELLGAPAARFEQAGSATSSVHDRANRRACNRKMRAQLGATLRFPDFQSGLRASI